MRRFAVLALCVASMIFYVIAAQEHGRRVNVSKARGDQSGYLWDAENVYANWHGRQPRMLIGERNRMPVYAGYLALFYHPDLTDPQYFEVGKVLNIYLSLGLLVVIAIVVRRELPAHVALNLTGIAMFGYFIYKAGYTQSELLFYFFFFLTFLGCWHLFRGQDGWRKVALGAVTGTLAAVTHLTKAAVPPFVMLFLAIFTAEPIVERWRGRSDPAKRRIAWRVAAALAFGIAYLAILSPYLVVNKRVFGHYFYNVNSTFYAWYDDWASASVGVHLHGDGEHWPDLPASEIPTARRYWREHTIRQMGARVLSGLQDMAIVSYRTYDFLVYLVLYVAMLGILAITRGRSLLGMIGEHAWLVIFLTAYAMAYGLATAFYYPVSGTGTARFLITHLLPLFFVLSRVFSSPRFELRAFHILVTVVLAIDIVFRTWPRLMTTYGGF